MERLNEIRERVRREIRDRRESRDELSVNRAYIITDNCCNSVAANLVGGNFLVGLLLFFNATSVQISYITTISYISNVLQLLSPLILERVAKRKTLLICARGLVYVLNIILIGLIATLPMGDRFKVFSILGVIALFNGSYALVGPGMGIWHMQSVPLNVRAKYFSNNQILVHLTVYAFIILGSAVLDVFKSAGNELTGNLVLRGVAVLAAALDIFWLCKVKEYPYEKSAEKVSLKLLFSLPFKEKRYLRSVMVVLVWSFSINMLSSYYSVYLLNTLGAKYSFITIAQALIVPIMMIMGRVWVRLINRTSWVGTLYKIVIVYGVVFYLHAFVTKGNLWFYYAMVIPCHICISGINIIMNNMHYHNIPRVNQSVYLTFSTSLANVAAMFGVLAGTLFITLMNDRTVFLFGLDMYPAQTLSLFMSTVLVAAGFMILAVHRRERRDEAPEEEA